MIPKKLSKRITFIEGKPLDDRGKITTFSRREPNNISPQTYITPQEEFESFFDYEEELSGLKPSSEQFANIFNDQENEEINEPLSDNNFVQMEEAEKEETNNINNKEKVSEINTSFIVMEDVDPLIMEYCEEKNTNNISNTEMPFEFIQCSFIKKDGNRCKRQAPKGGTLCSSHREK